MTTNLPDQNQTDRIDQGLDSLLDLAASPPHSPELASTILMTAMLDKASKTPASPSLHSNITAAAFRTESNIVNLRQKLRPATAPEAQVPGWLKGSAVGGLMAASLIIGIWSGSNGLIDPLIAAPMELAGLDVSESGDDLSEFDSLDDDDFYGGKL
jgi:hypothetical protein